MEILTVELSGGEFLVAAVHLVLSGKQLLLENFNFLLTLHRISRLGCGRSIKNPTYSFQLLTILSKIIISKLSSDLGDSVIKFNKNKIINELQ